MFFSLLLCKNLLLRSKDVYKEVGEVNNRKKVTDDGHNEGRRI